jgi:hypothetical protein
MGRENNPVWLPKGPVRPTKHVLSAPRRPSTASTAYSDASFTHTLLYHPSRLAKYFRIRKLGDSPFFAFLFLKLIR